jgi:V8-like Glu-specific endopeptidase
MRLFKTILFATAVSVVAATGASAAGKVTSVKTLNQKPFTAAQMRAAVGLLPKPSRLPAIVDSGVGSHAAGVAGGARGFTPGKVVTFDKTPKKAADLGLEAPSAFGTGGHPFTTKAAYGYGTNAPTNLYPWAATGKLYMNWGSAGSYVCTASLIRPGIAVTAAHCLTKYGSRLSQRALSVTYAPAKFDGTNPFGLWTATTWYVPTVYVNGTDTCTQVGVVCANDLAVVVLAKNASARYPGVFTGWYGIGWNGYSMTGFLGKTAGQITQLGYPAAFNSGLRMIRTDSLGYRNNPNNILIGSDQTGGSSGGPWLMNFGIDPSSANSAPAANIANVVVATTSWGYINSAIKIQGASMFGNNAAFPTTTNIHALLNAACGTFADRC